MEENEFFTKAMKQIMHGTIAKIAIKKESPFSKAPDLIDLLIIDWLPRLISWNYLI
jgi:hypothetical protein